MELETTFKQSKEETENGVKNLQNSIRICVKKVRRGRRTKAKQFNQLRPKLSTFKKILAELKPSLFLVEEAKYKDKGKLKIDGNYTIFESVQKSRDGGVGLALGCDKLLHPVWLRDGEEMWKHYLCKYLSGK